jgi:hypothetical protein
MRKTSWSSSTEGKEHTMTGFPPGIPGIIRQQRDPDGWLGPHWIRTFTGKTLHFEDPRPEDIDIVDIGHALSHLCRFSGHTSTFYSVASHSVLVAEKFWETSAEPPPDTEWGHQKRRLFLACLLHDAAEAYVADIPSPLKVLLNQVVRSGHTYRSIHEHIERVIYRKFGIEDLLGHSTIRLYDRAALVFEAEAFLDLNADGLHHMGFQTEFRGLWNPWFPTTYAKVMSLQTIEESRDKFHYAFDKVVRELVGFRMEAEPDSLPESGQSSGD